MPTAFQNLFLIGYRGTGKTTVARLLAAELGWSALDADVVLETTYNRTIRDIFAAEGEAGFRDKETAVLREMCAGTGQVIATGGGVILRPENRDRLRQSGHVVWLTACPGLIWERMQADATTAGRRPNLTTGGQAEVEELLRVREPLYAACADRAVATDGLTPAEVTQAVLRDLPR